jgi:ADP-dependent NAD(P)H-hydrate dehydratase
MTLPSRTTRSTLGAPPLPALPHRPKDGHKGTFGTVVVIGGCATMLGAPCFCALGALRCGAGLVRLATPPTLQSPALTLVPSAISMDLPDDAGAAFVAGLDAHAVVVVGPGLGATQSRRKLLRALWGAPQRLVLDGDALTLLAELVETLPARTGALVLTPHPGEAARLTRSFAIPLDPLAPAQRAVAAAALALRFAAVITLKGAGTVVSDGVRSALNRTGGPALAIPGSGDVLSGAIAGLMAQGLPAFAAAHLGVHLHGLAGDLWTRHHGASGLIAQDLAALLPDAIKHLRGQPGRSSTRSVSPPTRAS